MEDIRPNSVVSFDTRYTTNHISMFKVLLHTLAPSMQSRLAVYIKFMELQYTLQYWKHPHAISNISASPSEGTGFDIDNVYDELLLYCDAQQKQQFSQMRNMLQTFRNLQSMMEMMDTLKELFPEGMGSGDGQGGFNPEMFTAMSSMFGGGDMDLSQFAQMSDLFSGG